MFCDSSDLADSQKLEVASDVTLLATLGHDARLRIVERLSEGAARQKDLVAELAISSGTASRLLGELTEARLIQQDQPGSHSSLYRLVAPERTDELLDLAALLASELSEAFAERAAAQAEVDRKRLDARKSKASTAPR